MGESMVEPLLDSGFMLGMVAFSVSWMLFTR